MQKRLEKQRRAVSDEFAKQPVLQRAVDSDDYLVFSFKNLVNEYDLKNKHCTDYVRSQLVMKLRSLSQQTWSGLFAKGKQSGGLEIIKKDCMKVALPACVTEDIGNLYVFRFNAQKARIIGLRVGDVFQILFIDAGLECYGH